jgi:hypothetical protein
MRGVWWMILSWVMMVSWVWFVLAQQPDTDFCSNVTRTENGVSWYNNTANCGNGNRTTTESLRRNRFWNAVRDYGLDTESAAADIAQWANPTLNNVISSNVQSIITKYCGGSLNLDGKIWNLTLNAIDSCEFTGVSIDSATDFVSLVQIRNNDINCSDISTDLCGRTGGVCDMQLVNGTNQCVNVWSQTAQTTNGSDATNTASDEDGSVVVGGNPTSQTSSSADQSDTTSDSEQANTEANAGCDEANNEDCSSNVDQTEKDRRKNTCVGAGVAWNFGNRHYRNADARGGKGMCCEYVGTASLGATDVPIELQDPSNFCCGIKLNTNVPFVGRCIVQADAGTPWSANADSPQWTTTTVTAINAFPRLMRALTNIVMTLILVGSMIMLIVSGVMYASGQPGQGKQIIQRVIVSLILLGTSGIILRLINPTFFN